MGLKETMARLAKMSAQNQGGGSGIKYFKPKAGKNNLLIVPTPDEMTGDPFLEWGEHRGLQEPSWKSVPCSKHNKGEECVICGVIDDLQKANWKGNFKLWKPIEKRIRYFSPVIDLDDLEAGLQWWGYGKSVLGQLENWLVNLEEDETPFYSMEAFEKVIVSYDKSADPSLQYKLDKKPLKTLPAGLDIEALRATIKPLSEVFKSSNQEELAEMLEEYIAKTSAEIAEAEDAEDEESNDESTDESAEEANEDAGETKLSGLKKGAKK